MVSASPLKEPRPYCLTLFSKTRFYGDTSKGLQYMRHLGGAGTSPPVIYTSNRTICFSPAYISQYTGWCKYDVSTLWGRTMGVCKILIFDINRGVFYFRTFCWQVILNSFGVIYKNLFGTLWSPFSFCLIQRDKKVEILTCLMMGCELGG